MEKKDLDWGNLSFAYMHTDYSYVCNYKDGAWEEGGLTSDHTVTLSECAGLLHYCQEVFEGLKAYTTENGEIIVTAAWGGSGNLYTNKKYRDFVFRFDFCFAQPGMNNGIGVRTNIGTDAAYDGMEIQILDHDDPIYADLHDYQQHGAVYGIIVPKRVKFGETGTWNSEEIRVVGDHMGMLATVMNALAVSDKLEQLGVPTEVFTSITMPQVAPAFTRKDALRAMDEGKIAIFGGGTGNPFFSTDTTTALRAVEVSADIMFKATMVDGVYDKDPHKYPDAKKYETLTFTKVLEDRLAVMDGTAATLCRDNKLPILVFDLADPDNIARAVQGENVGTLVYEG